jgi:hypothetical protein
MSQVILLDDKSVIEALSKVQPGLQKYLHIRNLIYNVDVSKNADFKQAFNGFYRMRQRPQLFYDTFYRFMEENKYHSPTFEQALTFLFEELDRVEASFSSKLVATINPELPIWDSIVLKNLGKKAPAYYRKNRLQETLELYDDIVKWYESYLKTEEANNIIQFFDETYPNTGLTNVKKIDFVLWQVRD